MRTAALATMFAAFATLTVNPSSKAMRLDDSYGVVAGLFHSEHAAKSLELGVGYVRMGHAWYAVEPDFDDNYQWEEMDTFVERAQQNGQKILFTLGGTPAWAKDSPSCSAGPACYPNLSAWYDFVYDVIDHYSGDLADITFGIWNEPNDASFLTPNYPSPYIALFEAAAAARNSANPSARLAATEVGTGGIYDGWFATVMAAISDDLAPQDVITFHWYPGSGQDYDLYYVADIVSFVGNGREMWLSETGGSGIYEWQYAQKVRDVVTLFQNRYHSAWTRMFVFQLHGGESKPEDLVRDDWSNKPAYYAYRNRIPGASTTYGTDVLSPDQFLYGGDQVVSAGGNYILRYQEDGNLVLYSASWTPLWSSNTAGHPGGFTVMQTDGNMVVYSATNVPLWSSGTVGNAGAFAQVGAGRFRIFSSDGTVLFVAPECHWWTLCF